LGLAHQPPHHQISDLKHHSSRPIVALYRPSWDFRQAPLTQNKRGTREKKQGKKKDARLAFSLSLSLAYLAKKKTRSYKPPSPRIGTFDTQKQLYVPTHSLGGVVATVSVQVDTRLSVCLGGHRPQVKPPDDEASPVFNTPSSTMPGPYAPLIGIHTDGSDNDSSTNMAEPIDDDLLWDVDNDDDGPVLDTAYLQSLIPLNNPPQINPNLHLADVGADPLPTHPTPTFNLMHQAPFMPFVETLIDNLPPVQISNPNPFVLGSENFGLFDFLRHWASLRGFGVSNSTQAPDTKTLIQQTRNPPDVVTYDDLKGDECDFQGLNWTAMGTSRDAARPRRRRTYRNHVNCQGSDSPQCMDQTGIPSGEDFFRFRKMNMRSDISLAHFQLRSSLACPTMNKTYYPSLEGIMCHNSAATKTEMVLNMRQFPGISRAVTTLDAGYGVLMAGTFTGGYVLQSQYADSSENFSEGVVGNDRGIINHVRIHQTRSNASPVAGIASNDTAFRVMDIETESFIAKQELSFAPNCFALSPDRRLRAIVGDDSHVWIANAETGEILQKLEGHRDFGFACDWSEDGRFVATGFQDRGIKIWDARRWRDTSGKSTPLHSMRSEMAGVRGLRFSPLGSGKNVLAAVEETDVINIIDADSFCSKQTFEVFGEIGGVSFANAGQDLTVLCCEADRGGLLQLERCGRSPEWALDSPSSPVSAYSSQSDDWDTPPCRSSMPRYPRGLAGDLMPF
jgi:hypothetical protein